MVSNQGKFIDRTPSILPAGKISDNVGDSVANCLKNYSLNDADAALKLVANVVENVKDTTYKEEPYRNKIRKGIYTEMKPILQPKTKTRYQTLINELKETTYDSHWQKVVGKGRDLIPGLPKGLNPMQTTFGVPTDKKETVKELVNPPKGIYQVLSESQFAHDLYRKSHNDYNPGERICRNYTITAFDSDKRFGMRTKYDARGIWVRCACTWHQNEPAIITNKIQADFLNKTRNRLGECLTPINIAEQLPQDFVYGKPCKKERYNLPELLKDNNCPPCQFKEDLKCWLKSFNKLKIYVKKYFSNITLQDLFRKLSYYDSENCNVLPLDRFYEICACFQLTFNKENFEPLLKLLSIICNDKINYKKFQDIVSSKAEPIKLMKIRDIPEINQYYVTSTQAAVCDYLIINNASCAAAGIPSIRSDLLRPIIPPPGGCRADLENLGEECSADILLNPSIYMNYGLSFRDFFMPRNRNVIRSLFEKAGHKLDDNTFEKLWSKGLEYDKTGLVCVDTFNKLLQKHYIEFKQRLMIDEATC